MIAPMLKYAFLVHHSRYEHFLQSLQALGLVHIETVSEQVSEQEAYHFKQLNKVQECLQALNTKKNGIIPQVNPFNSPADLLKEYEDISAEEAELKRRRKELKTQIDLLEPWGEMPETTLQTLQQNQVYLHFYQCNEHDFLDTWQTEQHLQIITQQNGKIYFVIISRQPDAPSLHGAEWVKLPTLNRQALKQQLKEVQNRLSVELPAAYSKMVAYKHLLQQYAYQLEDELALLHTHRQTTPAANGKIMLLNVWLPQKDAPQFKEWLKQTDAFYLKEKPTPKTPNVPILLQNNRFAQLFQPIGKIFALPGYAELDLTPFFAPFFMLFFGMCLSDVAYGFIIFALVTVFKYRPQYAHLKPILTLGQFLGGAAIIFGLLTGSVAGINLSTVNLPELNGLKQYFLQANSLFNLSLGIGLVQIMFGMALKVVNRIRLFGFLYSIATIGWIMALAGTLLWALTPYTLPAYTFVGLGVFCIVFFSDPDAGLLKRIGLGLWDIYGVTGLFGDVLSYIRLFALGLSSATLGYVVNTIALSALALPPVLGELAFLFILLFGHGLNFGISTLSAFVHPIRLTFVEFYKNAGFTGGGQAFTPFRFKQ
ncbi:MAG TPA: V-type ATPase 116kDa subunit family protein [Chitinophagales bacterium]|nr:V-type ATPase 116kDa subunit family protein [Chitinophagales bacterium]HRK27448.1 V-type ATPase 116kDa subunit family protein [Chitinophagales bacterium]